MRLGDPCVLYYFRKNKFIMESLRFYISTWNVATRSPKHDLNSFLDYPSTFNENRVHPDFYILGFQEVKAGAQNIIIESIFEDPWTKKLSKILSKAGYVAAKFVKLQGLFLIVFTLTKHLPHIRDLEANYIRTGLGGLWGNKGAVAIRFNIYGCSFCFINSHLAAHDKYYKARLEEYHYIVNSLTFKVHESYILDHDYVFWLGDLNFRILEETEGANTHDEILNTLESAEKSNYSVLLENDQLNFARANGLAFSEFREAEIRFMPTFKFEIDTDVYNIKRRPAWTDRVLSRVIPDHYEGTKLGAHTVVYHSLPQYKQSDHKPVVAEFDVKVRTKTEYIILRQGPMSRSGRDGVSDKEPTKIVSHYKERTVEFAPINESWYWEDETFTITCTLSPDIRIYKHDYIAIFKVDFKSLDDPITTVEIRDITNVDELEEFHSDDESSSSDSETSDKDLEALPGLINKALTTTLVTTNNSTKVSGMTNQTKTEASGPSVSANKLELEKDSHSASAITETKDESKATLKMQETALAAKTDENAPEAKEPRTVDLTFKAKVAKQIKKKGYFVFMYISKPRSGVKSCLGISEPFEVTSQEKEDDSGSEDEDSDVDSNASTGPGSRCSTPPPEEEFDNLSISHDKCFDFVALKKRFETLGNDNN